MTRTASFLLALLVLGSPSLTGSAQSAGETKPLRVADLGDGNVFIWNYAKLEACTSDKSCSLESGQVVASARLASEELRCVDGASLYDLAGQRSISLPTLKPGKAMTCGGARVRDVAENQSPSGLPQHARRACRGASAVGKARPVTYHAVVVVREALVRWVDVRIVEARVARG